MELDGYSIDIYEHIPYIKKLCLDMEAEHILELGVRSGNSTRAFIQACKILDAELISIDTDDCGNVADYNKWTFLQMNDLDYTPDKMFDIIFIDTSHTYEQTIQELNKFHKYLKPSGKILLHDTTSCQGVYDAIMEFVSHNTEYEFENIPYCNGLGILWRNVQA